MGSETTSLRVFIDGDAFPAPARQILFRASARLKIPVVLVAAGHMKRTASSLVSVVNVPVGQDAADNRIVELVNKGDLVITADIPLAARVVEKKAFALNPRGELYDENTVKERLAMRNFMEELRSSGVETAGPKPYSNKDKERFAHALDRFLTEYA